MKSGNLNENLCATDSDIMLSANSTLHPRSDQGHGHVGDPPRELVAIKPTVRATGTMTTAVNLSSLPVELLLRILSEAVAGVGHHSSTSRSQLNAVNLLIVRLRPIAACSRSLLGLTKAVIARHRRLFAMLAVGLSPAPEPTPVAQYEYQWAPRSLADHLAQRPSHISGRYGPLPVSLDLYIHFTAPYSSPPMPGTRTRAPPEPPRRDSAPDSVFSPDASLSQLRHLTLYLPAHVPTHLESLTHLTRPLVALLDISNPTLRSLSICFAADAQQGIQLWALQFARAIMSRASTITHLSLSLPVTWAATTPDPLVHSALVDLLTRSPAVLHGLQSVELEWPDLRVDIIARLAQAATGLRKLTVRPMYWLPGPDDVTMTTGQDGPHPSLIQPTTLILGDAKSSLPPLPSPSTRFFTSCTHLVLELTHIRPPAAAHIAAVLVPGTGLLPIFPNLAPHLPPTAALTLSWRGIPTCKSPTSLMYALNGIAHHRPHAIRDLGLIGMRKDLLAYIRLASVHRVLVHTAVTESASAPGVLDADPLDVLVPHVMTMVPNARQVWVVVDYPPSLPSSSSPSCSSAASSGSAWAAFGSSTARPWFHELVHDRPALTRLVLVVRGRHAPPLDMLAYAGYKGEWVASGPWVVGEHELGRRESVRVEMGPGVPMRGAEAEDRPPALDYLGFGEALEVEMEDVWSLVLTRNTC
ncbi:hypothetical protein BCR44DRAFT_1447855, partial [Catenaria anguillulae PL171]